MLVWVFSNRTQLNIMSLPGKPLGFRNLFSAHSCRCTAKGNKTNEEHSFKDTTWLDYYSHQSHHLAAAPRRPHTAPPSEQLCPACWCCRCSCTGCTLGSGGRRTTAEKACSAVRSCCLELCVRPPPHHRRAESPSLRTHRILTEEPEATREILLFIYP